MIERGKWYRGKAIEFGCQPKSMRFLLTPGNNLFVAFTNGAADRAWQIEAAKVQEHEDGSLEITYERWADFEPGTLKFTEIVPEGLVESSTMRRA